jgi:hypothetical protein
MASGPYASELIHDLEFNRLVANIGQHPGMYVTPPTLGGIMAYMDGFSRGRGGSPLLGLREWLVVRAQEGNNLHWAGLVCREISDDRDAGLTRREDPKLLTALTELLQEFLAHREANGLSKLFWDYAKWLRRQDWYSGPLPPAADADV